jgi:hypothetical protein
LVAGGRKLSTIHFFESPVTDAELAQVNADFDKHTIEHGNPIEIQEPHSVVIMDGETFVGLKVILPLREMMYTTTGLT